MKIAPQTSSRVRTSFDPEFELPRLHQWFAENPHPSRLTLQMYVKELNSLSHRQSRKMLEIHNLCYWFKNARAAYKRAELRMKRQSELQAQQQQGTPQQPQDTNSTRLPPNGTPSPASSPEQRGVPMELQPHLVNGDGSNQLGALVSSLAPLNVSGGAKKSSRRDQSNRLRMADKRAQSFNQLARLDAASSDLNCESSSRGSSISPSSTVSLPAVIDGGSAAGGEPLADHHCKRATTTGIANGFGSGSVSAQTLNSVDLAQAVNCLLSTASNITAAAAAAAAAAASTQLSSNPAAAASNLLQVPPGALSLAASLINSNIISNQLATAAAVENNLACQPVVPQVGADLVEQPAAMRNVFSAFSPINQHFALGFLDNHRLDTKILSNMVFPTSFAVDNFAPASPAGARQLANGVNVAAAANNISSLLRQPAANGLSPNLVANEERKFVVGQHHNFGHLNKSHHLRSGSTSSSAARSNYGL